MSRARVMIVEDEVIVAEDLRQTLEVSGYEVVGDAVEGPEAVQMAQRLHPDVVLMDLALTGPSDGIHATREILGSIDTVVVVVSAHSNESTISQAVRSGAFGYVIKPFQPRQLTSSIQIALRRRMEARRSNRLADVAERTSLVALPQESIRPDSGAGSAGEMPQAHLRAMIDRLQALLGDERLWSDARETPPDTPTRELPVTPREREIIRGLVCYRRLATVADVLGISVHTARNHLKSVFRKLNLHSQDELLRFLLEGEGGRDEPL